MVVVDEFIEDFLEHRIYDPIKAHEYYLRTRELKGRRSASDLHGKKKKEGWAYVQSVVKDQKKAENTALSEKNKADIQQLRDLGKVRSTELAAKIKDLLQGVSANTKSQIAAIPKGLTKEQHAARVAEIRALGNSAKVSNTEERKKMASDLKSSIDDARTAYKAAREKVKAKYEAILNTEFDAIRTGAR